MTVDSHQVFSNEELSKLNFYSEICLSDNPKMYLFLEENPHFINRLEININKNDWAFNFLIKHPEYITQNFLFNENDLAVDYIIENLLSNSLKNKINKLEEGYIKNINFNKNTKMVNFIINNPSYFNKHILSLNTNDTAVNYLINNPTYIDGYNFSFNTNEKAIKFLISNPEYLNIKNFATLDNDLAVDYCIEYMEINKLGLLNFKINKNKKAIEYIKKFSKLV